MNTTQLAKFNNSWYKPGNKIVIAIWYIINAVVINNSLNFSSGLKIFFLRLFGAKIGKNVVLKPSISIKYPWLLVIENNVWIGEHVWIDNLALVTIKDNCCISQGAMLLCGNHNYKKETFDLIVKNITLEQGAWIGAKAIVCPGVHVKSHAILTVGSVAVNNLEPYTIYQGNPASILRKRDIV